jgi:hypothetical protein
MFLLGSLAMFAGTAFWGGVKVSANHPVLVEGNCDSPVPGTTIVSAGTCGDYDGDGRIGTAEDTDGADRIFGTLAAALGPGTGAAAGTGANMNGAILIVRSGRFAESLVIGNAIGSPYVGGCGDPSVGNCTPGNVTIEAAPGVSANIDAVLQGDPAGGNNARQGQTGIVIYYPFAAQADRVVTLRNLTIRNFSQGVGTAGRNNILIDNCRFENNIKSGITVTGFHKLVISRSQFQGNGRRISSAGSVADPGDGVAVEGSASVKIFDSLFSNNAGAGIRNSTGVSTNVTLFKVATYFNGADIVGPVTIAPDHNYAN